MGIRALVFDLDDTLYPRESGLMPVISSRIAVYMEEAMGLPHQEADRLRIKYKDEFGSTLAGLVHLHGMDPEPYTDYVYNVPYEDFIKKDDILRRVLERFAGDKYIYTNGAYVHAQAVIQVLGVEECFKKIISIESTGFYAKPSEKSFLKMLEIVDIPAGDILFFDDQLRNVLAAQKQGMAGVLVGGRSDKADLCIAQTRDFNLAQYSGK